MLFRPRLLGCRLLRQPGLMPAGGTLSITHYPGEIDLHHRAVVEDAPVVSMPWLVDHVDRGSWSLARQRRRPRGAGNRREGRCGRSTGKPPGQADFADESDLAFRLAIAERRADRLSHAESVVSAIPENAGFEHAVDWNGPHDSRAACGAESGRHTSRCRVSEITAWLPPKSALKCQVLMQFQPAEAG